MGFPFFRVAARVSSFPVFVEFEQALENKNKKHQKNATKTLKNTTKTLKKINKNAIKHSKKHTKKHYKTR